MKKFKKILYSVLIGVFSIGYITPIFAASGYGFSVGADLSDPNGEDTRTFATYVQGQMSSMGYSAIARTGPTYSNIFMEIPGVSPTRWWLESDVIYLAGHGAYNNVSFTTSGRTGPEYNIMITNTNTYNYSSPYGTIGIGVFNASKIKLIMFQGCNTASNNSSITHYANNVGARTAIGWKLVIYRNSIADWQNRFWPYLASGHTIQQAVNYANSFNYSNNNVKELHVAGSTSATVNSLGGSSVVRSIDDNREYLINKNIDNHTEQNIISEIENIIKTNINSTFDIDNYIIEKSNPSTDEGTETIYDIILKINGVETNLAYTVFFNSHLSKITKVYDNKNGLNVDKLMSSKRTNISKTLSVEKEKEINDVKKSILEKNNVEKVKSSIDKVELEKFYTLKKYYSPDMFEPIIYKYSIIGEHKYYDAEKDKLYYVIDVESKEEETGSIFVYSEYIELN